MLLKDLTLLFIDDEEEIQNYMNIFLNRHVKSLFVASNAIDGLKIFYKHKPDIIVCNVNIPYLSGIEIATIIKADNIEQSIILTSSTENTTELKKMIDLKIDKFIKKPIVNIDSLLNDLREIAKNKKDKRLNKALMHKTANDTLTGLCNRYKINEILLSETSRNNRFGKLFSIILINIDNFKEVNNTYGHLTGDKILIEMANILKNHSNVTDIVGRFNGDEFIVIAPEANVEKAFELAENLRIKIEEYSFYKVGHKSVSMGIVECSSNDDINIILKKVNDALWKAKKTGKNRVCI